MKRNLMVALAAALAVSCLAAARPASQATKKAQDSREDVSQLVSVLDHVWLDAARNHDTGTMAWLFSDDFVEVHNGGGMVSKGKQIEQIRSSTTDLTELYPSDIQVRYVSPDIAILTDITTIKGTRDGQNIGGKYRVLRIFNKQNGRGRRRRSSGEALFRCATRGNKNVFTCAASFADQYSIAGADRRRVSRLRNSAVFLWLRK